SDMSFSDTDKLVALNAVTSDGFYQRAYAASQHGISVDSFVGFKEQLPRFDHNGNGSYTQAEVAETLNSFQELNNDQRAVLWQIQTGGKHNPYNSAIGAQVKAEIADSKTVGTAQNAAERETKGRKTFGNGLLSAFMDNTDTSVQKTEQQALGNGLLSAYMD
ncbi:MAG: hypothetical protein RSB78_06860, partial [Oscillospiraceae bacterium]